jgi:nicotinamidase/pyrazinamidase
MSRLAFWDVDTQVDFILPVGKLYVPGAEKILSNLRKLTSYAAEQKIPIVSSVDAHLLSDPEFRQYPPHCIAGTPGQAKVEGTVLGSYYVVPNRKLQLPPNLAGYSQIILEKQATDVFTNPNTDEVLRLIASRKEIVMYGVVTEICVDQAARGLTARGYRVHAVTDAMQAFDEAKGRETLAFMTRRSGQLLTTTEVLSGAPAKSAA